MVTDGEYIVERLLPVFVQEICREQHIDYRSFSDNWMLRLERDGIRKWVIGYTFDLNPAASVALSSDKVASYQALTADGLPAIEHYLARSRASAAVLAKNLTDVPHDRPVVIKPLQGASGHGIHLFSRLDEATAYVSNQAHTDWTISPWYDIAAETRLIIGNGTLVHAYEKQNPVMRDGLLFYNLSMGARAIDIEPTTEMVQLSCDAVKSIGLNLAAVDIVTLADGSTRILEINSGIMMEHYARQSDEYKNRARGVYGAIIESMFN